MITPSKMTPRFRTRTCRDQRSAFSVLLYEQSWAEYSTNASWAQSSQAASRPGTIQAQSCLTSMSIKSKELLLSATISLLYPSLELWRQSSSKAIGCNQTTTLDCFSLRFSTTVKNRPDDSVFVFPSVSSDRKERERKKGGKAVSRTDRLWRNQCMKMLLKNAERCSRGQYLFNSVWGNGMKKESSSNSFLFYLLSNRPSIRHEL